MAQTSQSAKTRKLSDGSRPSKRLLLGDEAQKKPRKKKKLTQKTRMRIETIMDQMRFRRDGERLAGKRTKRS